MKPGLNKENAANTILLFFFVLFLTGLVFSLRALSSVSAGLLLIAGLKNYKQLPVLFRSRKTILFFSMACAAFWGLQAVSLFFTETGTESWKDLRLKSGLLFIPLFVGLNHRLIHRNRPLFLRIFCGLLCIALLFCFASAFAIFIETNDPSAFFYHNLVKPLRQHAVYFSVYTFIAAIFLLESVCEKKYVFTPFFHYTILIFFCVSLFFLSSKLVLAFFLTSIIYYTIRIAGGKIGRQTLTGILIVLLLASATILFTRNRVSDRFRDMFSGDPGLVKQDSFHPGVYFNAIQFRLLQAKLVPQILNEQKGWWTGVGTAKAQPLLNDAYRSKNMYIGDPLKGDHGYLGYNTHNQFLESLLINGVPGFLLFLFVFVALLQLAWQKRRTGYVLIYILLAVYACVESVFETQYGIVLFCFFPLFFALEE